MKHICLKIFFILAGLSLVIASCSKSDSKESQTSIVATWTFAEFGEDDNENDVIDAGETVTVEAVGAHGTLALKSDHTYSDEFFDGANPYTENGTYTYENNVITTTTGGGTPNTYKVFSLTNNKMVIKQTTSSPGNWIILTK